MRYGEMTDEQRKRYAAEIARKRAAGYPEYNYVALLEARVFELEARVFEHEKTEVLDPPEVKDESTTPDRG